MIKMINSLLNIKSIKNNFSSLFQHRKDNAKKKKRKRRRKGELCCHYMDQDLENKLKEKE